MHYLNISGQNKLPVCEEDFYSLDYRDNRCGRIQFQSVCVTFLAFVPKNIDASIATGHFPQRWHTAPNFREAQPSETVQQWVIAHQRVALCHHEDKVLMGGGMHASGKRQHVGLGMTLLCGRVEALNEARWFCKEVHVIFLPTQKVNGASQIDSSCTWHGCV